MRIGFIGTGKISSAIIEAICTSDMHDYQIFVSPRNKDISLNLEAKFEKVSRLNSNQEIIDSSDLVFLALRPPVFSAVISELNFRKDHSVISVIPFSAYQELLELISPASIISRATPLPTVVNHICPIPVYKPSSDALTILNLIGQPFEVSTEQELHSIWTLTCLISPFYDMLSSLSDWAAENSVPKELANKYVADMFHTLANAAHQSENPDFNELSYHAATPGGLNEKTAKEIKNVGAHNAYIRAADGILELFKTKCDI